MAMTMHTLLAIVITCLSVIVGRYHAYCVGCRNGEAISPNTGSTSQGNCNQLVYNYVYGCFGTFTGGMYGDAASQVCSDAFEPCPSATRTSELGLTSAKCGQVVDMNVFFASQQSSDGMWTCKAGEYYNDVWGCAKQAHDNPIANIAGTSYECTGGCSGLLCEDSLIAVMGDYEATGWSVGSDTSNEISNIGCTDSDYGGVLCCRIPTTSPTIAPSLTPTNVPSNTPSAAPTITPSVTPSAVPTMAPTSPTLAPTDAPTQPSAAPTVVPTDSPTFTRAPTSETFSPTVPTDAPTDAPTLPSSAPTLSPIVAPSAAPTHPTNSPTLVPSDTPTDAPTSLTTVPSNTPTGVPTNMPTHPSQAPTAVPTGFPTVIPSTAPVSVPTDAPTGFPTAMPSFAPVSVPTDAPSPQPTPLPTHNTSDWVTSVEFDIIMNGNLTHMIQITIQHIINDLLTYQLSINTTFYVETDAEGNVISISILTPENDDTSDFENELITIINSDGFEDEIEDNLNNYGTDDEIVYQIEIIYHNEYHSQSASKAILVIIGIAISLILILCICVVLYFLYCRNKQLPFANTITQLEMANRRPDDPHSSILQPGAAPTGVAAANHNESVTFQSNMPDLPASPSLGAISPLDAVAEGHLEMDVVSEDINDKTLLSGITQTIDGSGGVGNGGGGGDVNPNMRGSGVSSHRSIYETPMNTGDGSVIVTNVTTVNGSDNDSSEKDNNGAEQEESSSSDELYEPHNDTHSTAAMTTSIGDTVQS